MRNNDRYGKETKSITELGLSVQALVKVYRSAGQDEFRVVEIQISGPETPAETYELGTIRLSNGQPAQPVKLVGRKVTLQNGNSLTPVVYLGEKDDTFSFMAPQVRYP